MESLSKKLGANTIFTGRLEGDTLNVWYNIAQIFILPSYLEPFGAVTNEALLAGCIGLISEKAGSQCLIKESVNGYTLNPHNIDDITDKMIKISSNTKPLVDIVLKKNQMQHSYNELINKVIEYLNNI